jgi:transmembrane sensor
MNASSEDQRANDAARWYARLQAPDCTPADRTDFLRWCAEDPANAEAFARAKAIAAALSRAASTNERLRAMAAEARATAAAQAAATRARRRSLAAITALAASVLAAVGIAVWQRPAATPESAVNTVHIVADDATRVVTLEDGTEVHVDVETTLEVRYGDSERQVVLERGRAVFDVAHDAHRPFSVTAGKSTVTALGTRFQVERSLDDVVVTLAEGAVTVTATVAGASREERLLPGEQLSILGRDEVLRRRTVDARAATSWSLGRLVFREERLIDAIREVNRYAAVKVRIADESLGDLRVSGTFFTGDSEAAVAAFAAVLPISISHGQDGEIVLTRR